MKRLKQAVRWMFAVVFALLLGASAVSAHADTSVLSTADHPFIGARNQGWWNQGGHSPGNPNYLVGAFAGFIFRDFFSFDLESLDLSHQKVISAQLEVTRYDFSTLNPSETLGLFDVTTDAATLNLKGAADLGIWEDLGSGRNYGMFTILPSVSNNPRADTLVFVLNDAALEDITRAAGGWFSIGGSLQGPLTGDEPRLFSDSYSGPVQQLVIETAPSTVPEPGGFALLFAGAPPLLCRLRRRA